jgi:hypothetical protein
MNQRIHQLREKIEPYRQEIVNHKVYSLIKNIEDLQVFMEYHVFAVWDFMSLLKALQTNLTCTTTPWFPKGSGDTRYLINEIVLGEESDIDLNGQRKSHFELYLSAMNQCGANTNQIEIFTDELKISNSFQQAFQKAKVPAAAKEFVDFTFKIIDSKKDHLQSAIFTFGREDLIPQMFISIINEIHKNFPNDISIFKYYIERHIEVDGEHHSHLALQMMENLCGNNEQFWNEAEEAIILSLKSRIGLWNGVYNQLTQIPQEFMA